MEAVATPARRSYPSDVSDDEWAFVAPYLTLMTAEAPQREHALREVFNGLRWLGRSGGCCPTTCRPGTPSPSRRSGG